MPRAAFPHVAHLYCAASLACLFGAKAQRDAMARRGQEILSVRLAAFAPLGVFAFKKTVRQLSGSCNDQSTTARLLARCDTRLDHWPRQGSGWAEAECAVYRVG